MLAPPGDFKLERALGTAYSLDAATLVAVPLFADGSDADAQRTPLGVQRIFELGKRLTLLVQGDRITVPQNVRPELLALLEDAVVPCSVPRASFHPKLLVLEYVDHETATRCRRVALSSRNLTVDSSWDFVVVLDEARTGGTVVPGLGEAVRSLARYVTSDNVARAECRRVGDLLDSTAFEPLPLLQDVGVRLFAPGSQAANEVLGRLTGDDLLVVSPFVRPSFLDRLARQAGSRRRVLVTRPVGVDDAVFHAFDVYQLREDLTDPTGTTDRDSPDDAVGRETMLRGLHAKMYFATDRERTAVVLTSANASPSGWGRNVEIAVHGLVPSSKLAVSDLLRPSTPQELESRDALRFGDLLVPLTRDGTVEELKDPPWLADARTSLASATVEGRLEVEDGHSILRVTITLDPVATLWPPSLVATVEPHAHPQAFARLGWTANDQLSCAVMLPPGSKVTRFLTVRLHLADESHALVVLARLVGEREWTAEDARSELVRELKPQFLRDLAWKVGVSGPEPVDTEAADGADRPPAASRPGGETVNPPILERLLANLYGSQAAAYAETIGGLIDSVREDSEFEELVKLWDLLRTVVR